MTLSRRQGKLLQTSRILETLGSTSAVPLSRFEAWRAPYMSIYGYTVMEQPVARDLFQSRKKCVRGKKKCSCPVRFGFVFHNNSELFPINFTNFLQLCRRAPAVIKPLFDLNVRLLPPSSPPCGFNFSQPYSPELVCAGKSAFNSSMEIGRARTTIDS